VSQIEGIPMMWVAVNRRGIIRGASVDDGTSESRNFLLPLDPGYCLKRIPGPVTMGAHVSEPNVHPPKLKQRKPRMTVDQLKDAVQYAFNHGAYVCPLAGKDKPEDHAIHCQACRIRKALSDERYLKPEGDEFRISD
jgi:hypothetical protein